jgi:hypothetical protein
LSKQKPTKKEDIFKGLEFNNDGFLQCTDKEMLERSKGLVSYVVKEVAKCFLTGRGVVGISLPVRIFEPRSALERVLDGFSFAPEYLTKACKTKDSLLRMKYVIAFVVSGQYMRANQFKPFNPLLGETMEGKFKDGTKIFMEHTCHHPPISNFLLEGPAGSAYKLFGSNEFVASIKNSGNVLNITFKGPNTIEFPDGEKITFYNPTNKVRGLMWGDKIISGQGSIIFVNEDNDMKAEVITEVKQQEISESDNPNYIEGLIYYSNGKTNKNEPDRVSKIVDIEETICEIYGNVLDHLYIDGEEYWNIDKNIPSRIQFPKVCLPSDARYREDLIWLFNEDEPIAQEWKLKLEVQQRTERKNRQTVAKKRKPKNKFIYNF